MKLYPLYKNSGIKWIGNIPKEWNIVKVKSGMKRVKSKIKHEDPIILSLTSKGVIKRDISNNEGQIAASYSDYNQVKKGDLLLNPMDLVSNAFSSVSNIDGVISQAYFNLRCQEGYNSKYYEYYFKLQYWGLTFFAHGKGVSFDNRWTLNNQTLMNYPIPLPPYPEQKKIADFLNYKDKLIDQLIKKTKKKIELLKEKRIALINHCITKGLNKHVEMKDSGIDWIEKMPTKWSIKKIKYLGIIKSGDSVVNDNLDNSKEYPVYGGNGIMGYYDDFNRTGPIIIIGRVGEKCGNVHLVNKKCWVTDNSLILDLFKKEIFSWIYYSLDARNLNTLRNQNTQPLVTSTLIKNEAIPFPTENEQKQIVRYLDDQTKKIDTAIEKENKRIELLKEYHKSLISEAVTGKIDVRDEVIA